LKIIHVLKRKFLRCYEKPRMLEITKGNLKDIFQKRIFVMKRPMKDSFQKEKSMNSEEQVILFLRA
jgi:hypothetical protein